MTSIKFMQVLQPIPYKELEKLARKRGVTIQELLRVLVIPDWLREYHQREERRRLRVARRNWRRR